MKHLETSNLTILIYNSHFLKRFNLVFLSYLSEAERKLDDERLKYYKKKQIVMNDLHVNTILKYQTIKVRRLHCITCRDGHELVIQG